VWFRIFMLLYSFVVMNDLGVPLASPGEMRDELSRARRELYSENHNLELELNLKLYKNKYLVREPVWIEISVTNVGKNKGEFCFASWEGIKIRDSKGKDYSSPAHIDRGVIDIEPGETLKKHFNVFAFGFGVSHADRNRGPFYLLPEKYTVSYHLDQKDQTDGSPEAEEVMDTFEVVEPKGEEAEALNLLLNSYDLKIQKKYRESTEKLQELLERYPNSVYAPWVMLKSADTPEARYELIKRFPHSREAVATVKEIVLLFVNKKDRRGFTQAMNRLVHEFPDTDIAKEAQSWLDNIDDRFFGERSKRDLEYQEEGEQ
jgi:hypothetical protein